MARPFFQPAPPDALLPSPLTHLLCVVFDFDGTLAPIRRRPEDAEISSRTRSLLLDLSRMKRVRVGIISGRSWDDLYHRVLIPEIYYGGCHGLEMRGPGLTFCHPQAEKFRSLMYSLAERLRYEVAAVSGAQVEDKGLAVSLHYRMVTRGNVPALEQAFYRSIAQYGSEIEVVRGKEVLEVRPRVFWDKGKALLFLLDHLALSEGRPPFCFYLGDDRTDEDAFSVLSEAGRGVAIRVGEAYPTLAAFRLQGIREVQMFMRWIRERIGS